MKRLTPVVGVWLGVMLGGVGFLLIFVAWAAVAGLPNIVQHLPYVVSGGLGGLALVILGSVTTLMATRARDQEQRLALLIRIDEALARREASEPEEAP